MLNSNAPHAALSCCVITPIGPGHGHRYTECRNSVLAAFKKNPGPFNRLEFAAMDDSQGLHGRSKRRNDGILYSIDRKIDWIFFLDADDTMSDTAFASFAEFHKSHDAVWGAILEQIPGQQERLRPNQVMPITSLCTLLDQDPMLTLQMGHFVRSEIAREVMFDTTMDSGEDFRYYLQLWRDYRCIKLDTPFFLNRRGIRSTGPRSASGVMWTEAVADVFVNFRIDNRKKIERLYARETQYTHGRHILISGFSRSGTTMFYNMLRHSVTNLDFLDKEYPAAQIIGTDPRNLVTKRPLDIFDIQNIISANKLGKTLDFIVLLRDIRSIITSTHKSVPDDYFISYDYQYFIPPNGTPTRTIPGILHTYQAIVQLFKCNLPGRKIIVRYEDLVQNTVRTQAYLAQVLQLGYRNRFENFHEAKIPDLLSIPLNKLVAPDETRIKKWKQPEHRERIRTQFTQCPALFDILIQTGYEKDRNWFEAL